MRLIGHSLMGENFKIIRVSVTESTPMVTNMSSFRTTRLPKGGLTLEVDRDLNLRQFGLIWPTIWQRWQVGKNLDFSFNLEGV